MECTRNADAARSNRWLSDRTARQTGELASVCFGALYLLQYFVPGIFGWPWNWLVCPAAGLKPGCRGRAVAVVLTRPLEALGFGFYASISLTLGVPLIMLMAVLGCVASAAPAPAAPVYFRRTEGPEAGKIEPLAEYDGIRRPQIYIAVKGRVFDVAGGEEFYGPEGGYSALAGQDASSAPHARACTAHTRARARAVHTRQ